MHRQRLCQSFLQAARGTGIQLHQLAVELGQRQLGGSMVFQSVSRVQLFGHRRFSGTPPAVRRKWTR
jgi:hypothetical protein